MTGQAGLSQDFYCKQMIVVVKYSEKFTKGCIRQRVLIPLSPSPCLSFQSFDTFLDNRNLKVTHEPSHIKQIIKELHHMTFFCDIFSANATFLLI